jgi:hypothetical protein
MPIAARALTLIIALAISLPALAFGTYRAGGKVLDQNDPSSKVVEAMGQPESKEPIFNRYGAQLGENWFYRDGGKTIKFTISGGRIVAIEEIR